jgi:uncharacterized protein YbjT (DUF2867 family)
MMGGDLTLVVGATGLLGMRIVRLLRDAGRSVRAIVRPTADPGKRAFIEAQGAEMVVADLKDPASIDRACRGVSAIVSTASATLSRVDGDSIGTVDEAGQLALIDAAVRAGVEHFVFVSFPPRDIDYALQRAKRTVEARLRESRISFTILQPVSFCDVWLSPLAGFDPLRGKAQIFGDGDRPISWISAHDVARFAAAASEGGILARKTIPLGGPDSLSPLAVVKMFEELGTPKVSLVHVSEETLRGRLAGARNLIEEAFAAIMLSMAQGRIVDPGPAIEALPGRLMTVREYAAQVVRDFQHKQGEMET